MFMMNEQPIRILQLVPIQLAIKLLYFLFLMYKTFYFNKKTEQNYSNTLIGQ